ncbi:hypothetical protein EVAR_70808_1 [Eumeta japonica]|uniref:Uncharacterized protein n=1 Tax=Eumeta variegata TaxID=151549 RepID=A0A4C1SW89_EUMVA|nr:hypothetical protein EVAR_70808_1 [Eumeta japonica]
MNREKEDVANDADAIQTSNSDLTNAVEKENQTNDLEFENQTENDADDDEETGIEADDDDSETELLQEHSTVCYSSNQSYVDTATNWRR